MSPRMHDHVTSRLDRNVIRGFDLFKAMTEPELDDILRSAHLRRIPQNQPVFRQGDPAGNFYILLHGRLKVVQVTPDGQPIVVRIVHPGELFGVAKALRRSDHPGTAMAAVESMALAWSSTLWDDMMVRHPALTMSALHAVGQHVQEAHARIRELSTEDVKRRVAHALVRLAAQAGRPTEDGILIDFPITCQDIAEMTGTTLFSVSRLLGAWEATGLVLRGRQRLLLHDPHKLQALCGRQQIAHELTLSTLSPPGRPFNGAFDLAEKRPKWHAVLVSCALKRVKGPDRATYATHPPREKDADRSWPTTHHLVDRPGRIHSHDAPPRVRHAASDLSHGS